MIRDSMSLRVAIAMFDRGFFTQRQLARKLKMNPEYLSHILSGHRKGYAHRAKIARALGLTVEEIFWNGRKGK